jgi:hypothetical protein
MVIDRQNLLVILKGHRHSVAADIRSTHFTYILVRYEWNSNCKASTVQVPNQLDPEGIKMTSDARTPNSLSRSGMRTTTTPIW